MLLLLLLLLKSGRLLLQHAEGRRGRVAREERAPRRAAELGEGFRLPRQLGKKGGSGISSIFKLSLLK